MKQLLLIACLLASSLNSVSSEDEECPAACSCYEETIGNFVARCSKFDSELKFGRDISRIVIENVEDLVLDKSTFKNGGLEYVSTIQFVNNTFKKLHPRAFGDLQFLETIDFRSNKQLVLDPDMFNETRSLRQLVIKNTELKFSRKSDYLFDVPVLIHLILSNCGITELHPDAFSKMTSLLVVSLPFNKLKILTTEFANLTELEDVDLSFNLLSEIGPGVFGNLATLKLRGNPLTTMADVHLQDCLDLDVSMCKFSKIDKSTFSGFSNVNYLNLGGNALIEIAEDSFSNMTHLKQLNLTNNALEGPLPQGLFQNLDDLGILDLSHNPKLRVLPENFFKGLSSLFLLDVSYCGLKNLENHLFEGLNMFSTLMLGGNLLDKLKLGVLTKFIVKLDLSYNKIEYLDDIKFPADSRLRNLNLAGNKLLELSTSALSDLKLLETLDLSSCSLSSLWNVSDSTSLENLQTLSVANNHITSINKTQLVLTPKLMGLDFTGNHITCDDSFIETIEWLKTNKVHPSIRRLSSLKSESLQMTSETESINIFGWREVKEQICGESDKETYDDEYMMNKDQEPVDDEDDEDDDDEDEEDDEDDENGDYQDNAYSTGFPNNGLDNIVWRQSTILADSNDNYLWSVIIVLFSVVAILVSLTVLAACVLRWSRQRNSYGARMINTHLHPPIMKRGRSSIYQQLYEDPNHPTTPIMPTKNSNQTQYNFPDGQGGKQFGYITYLSKDFHDSTVIPESV